VWFATFWESATGNFGKESSILSENHAIDFLNSELRMKQF
jgi:hypothetical protein